jgi:hypothetical protein
LENKKMKINAIVIDDVVREWKNEQTKQGGTSRHFLLADQDKDRRLAQMLQLRVRYDDPKLQGEFRGAQLEVAVTSIEQREYGIQEVVINGEILNISNLDRNQANGRATEKLEVTATKK